MVFYPFIGTIQKKTVPEFFFFKISGNAIPRVPWEKRHSHLSGLEFQLIRWFFVQIRKNLPNLEICSQQELRLKLETPVISSNHMFFVFAQRWLPTIHRFFHHDSVEITRVKPIVRFFSELLRPLIAFVIVACHGAYIETFHAQLKLIHPCCCHTGRKMFSKETSAKGIPDIPPGLNLVGSHHMSLGPVLEGIKMKKGTRFHTIFLFPFQVHLANPHPHGRN